MAKDHFDKVVEEQYDKLAEEGGFDDEGDDVVDEVEDEIAEPEDVEQEEPEQEPEREEPEQEQQAEEPRAEVDPIPPHTWPAEWKETFNKLPAAARRDMLEMNRHMAAGFTKRMQQVNQKRRELEGIERSVQPHMERLSRAGISTEVAVQRALAWDAHIQQHGAKAILDQAKAYGIDLSQAQQPAEEYLTPTERALHQRLEQVNGSVQQQQAQMQQWYQHQQQQEQNRRLQNAHAVLDEFINARDQNGKPLHPYIEHVAPTMAKLIEAQIAPDIESAYRMAANSNPDIQAALNRQRQEASVQAQRRKAEKVRKASSGVVTKSSSKGGKKPQGFEDQLSRMYDKVANR